ncbi:MAG TPA: alpha/beta hydrolase [Thermoleophilaceae bacterium]|nr:alpha/beta hydrolase [Thermoleophilaceae bacterium]
MLLKTRTWGGSKADAVICLHGITQHGGIFEPLARRLAQAGRYVASVDLRGHGDSGREPPWNVATHVGDLLETVDGLGIERATWIGHSYGGRIAATLADRVPERVSRLALLDAGLQVEPDHALGHAELDRLDWSFATVAGATNAMMASESIVAAPEETVAAYVEDDVRRGPDGRFRFRFCPSAVVVAWSEMTLPPPPIAKLPTLIVAATAAPFTGRDHIRRYREALGPLLTVASVPNGHNVLWESPLETTGALESFLAKPA